MISAPVEPLRILQRSLNSSAAGPAARVNNVYKDVCVLSARKEIGWSYHVLRYGVSTKVLSMSTHRLMIVHEEGPIQNF